MTDLRKAAEMAATDLKELIHWHSIRDSDDKLMPAHNQTPEIKSAMESFEALRQALADTDHFRDATKKIEPMAWMKPSGLVSPYKHGSYQIPLYTAPPKREWISLTDEEIYAPWPFETRIEFARWVEAKLKEKNT